jgi:hypothetical protein
MENQTHAFTESGLGQAPFTFSEVSEGSTGCAHCGTGIINQFHIVSADGVNSVVGSTCIQKSGDQGLIDIAKAEKNRKAREKAHAKHAAQWASDQDAQRERNGGLTDREVQEAAWQAEADAEAARKAPIAELLKPLADLIADGKGGFCDSISRDLEDGDVPFGGGFNLTAEIIAKKKGRKNSEAFKVEFDRVIKILNQAKAAA